MNERHIRAGFFGQIREYLPEVRLPSGTADSFIDISRPAVIRSQHQIPVTVNSIHIFEITTGGMCSLYRVTTFVNKTVDLQSVNLSGRKHERHKPQAPTRDKATRIQGTFHHSQIFQFDWQVMLIQNLFDDWKIKIRHTQHITYQITTAVGI